MKRIFIYALTAAMMAVSSLVQAQVYPSVTYRKILQSPPPLECVGVVKCLPSGQTKAQRWSVGCECLDRDMAVFSGYKKYVSELGVGYARIQSGWMKTEQKKGRYDFKWLDEIVDGLLEQNVTPWMCIGYGNPLYGCGATLADPIFTDEATYAAWDRYVEALVKQYKGRVNCWEVWNEPNIGANKEHPERYVKLLLRTSAVIRKVDPQARIAAFAMASLDAKWLESALKQLKESGQENIFDVATLHKYFENPDEGDYDFKMLGEMINSYFPGTQVIQGESGCPSMLQFCHALKHGEWTEYTQAKVDLRRMSSDFALGQYCSIFTIADVTYHQSQVFYGLLRTSLEGEVMYKKPAFHAVRNMVNILPDNIVPIPQDFSAETSKKLKVVGLMDTETGKRAGVMVYFSGQAPTNSLEFEKVRVTFKDYRLNDPVYVEPISGKVFKLDRWHYSPNDPDRVYDLPLWDSPVFLMEKSAVRHIATEDITTQAFDASFNQDF